MTKFKKKFKVGDMVFVVGKVIEVEEGHSEPYRVEILYNGIRNWFTEKELTKFQRREKP